MAVSKQDIIDAIKEMSSIELAEFVTELEEVFGVSAAAAVVAVPGAGGDAGAAEEKTDFDVVLDGFGDNKIAVIKVVREVTGLGLKEAKDMVEAAPTPVVEGVNKDKADEVAGKLKDAGAAVTVK